MRCSKCGYDNPEGARFCINCGARLSYVCPECGSEIPFESKYCPNCGAKIDFKSTPGTQNNFTVHSKSGERKNIAVMFADLSEFTTLSTVLDPEELQQVIAGYFDVMTPVVHKYDGYIDKFIGDSIMALFGAPIAHEDASLRAVLCGMELLDEIKQYNLRNKYKRSLSIGINYGLVATGKVSKYGRYTVMGEVVNLAKRLESAAEDAQILVSESIYKNTNYNIEYGKPISLHLKGFSRRVVAYEPLRVIKGIAIRNITETQLIGREKEMNVLLRKYDKVCSGKGQVIGITGEAGIGKSKLAYEFSNRVIKKGNVKVLKVQGADYLRESPYRLLKELLRYLFDFSEEYKMSEKVAIVERKINEWANKLDVKRTYFSKTIPFVKYILDLPMKPEQIQRFKSMKPGDKVELINETISDFFVILSKLFNILIVLDDAQWGDESSMIFFRRLADKIKNTRIMMLYTFRTVSKNKGNTGKYVKTPIKLSLLNKRETGLFVCKLTGCTDIEKKTKNAIFEMTEGNPFFVEEIITTLRGEGKIVVNGGIASIPYKTDLDIPDRLKEIILARVDKLEKPLKTFIRYASVIGNEFSLSVLNLIIGNMEMLKLYANALIEANFIKTRRKNTEGKREDNIYLFKHNITKDVVYDSILKNERKKYHEQVARAYEVFYMDNLVPFYDTLAYHFTQAGLKKESFDYLMQSAKRMEEMNRHNEAIERYLECLSIKEDPDLYLKIGFIYENIGKNSKAEESYNKAYEIADDFLIKAKAIYRKASLMEMISQYEKAMELLDKAENLLKKYGNSMESEFFSANILSLKSWILRILGDTDGAFDQIFKALAIVDRYDCKETDSDIENLNIKRDVLNSLGILYMWTGKFKEALQSFERILDIGKVIKNKRTFIATYNNIALLHENMGKYDIALKYYKRNLTIAKELGDRHKIAIIYGNLGRVYGELIDYTRSIYYFKKYLKVSKALNNKREIGIAYGNLGVSYQGIGDYKRAIKCLKRYLEISKEVGNQIGVGIARMNFAEVYYEIEEYEKAEKWAKQALKIIESTNLKYYFIPIYHILFQTNIRKVDRGNRNAMKNSEKYLNKMIEISEELGVEEGKTIAIANKGILLSRKYDGNKDKKILGKMHEMFQKAIKMARKIGNEKSLAEYYVEYGDALKRVDDKNFKKQYLKARSIYEKLKMMHRVDFVDKVLKEGQ